MESGSESDAPEELTVGEGIKQHEEIRKAQREHKIRVAKESKERRRQWAQKKAAAKSSKKEEENTDKTGEETGEDEMESEDGPVLPGMLPKEIIERLAAREKQTFSSDSEEEIINKNAPTKVGKNKKRRETNGPETIVLTELPPPKCLENSMEFLKKRRMQVARSDSVLKNAKQSLRLLSSKGGLLS